MGRDMSHTVELPALGESVTEGTVTRWLVAVGDTVAVDDPIVEVSTDKVDTEIPSPVAGVVEQILVEEDEDVEVGAALVVISGGHVKRGPALPGPRTVGSRIRRAVPAELTPLSPASCSRSIGRERRSHLLPSYDGRRCAISRSPVSYDVRRSNDPKE